MQSGVNNRVNIINIVLLSYAQFYSTKIVNVLKTKGCKEYECRGVVSFESKWDHKLIKIKTLQI